MERGIEDSFDNLLMKKKFSTKWKASKQPRKQRKYSYNAPLHLRHKALSSTLDKELRKKHGIRNIEIRKNDEVKIMAGDFKGKSGKINKVNYKLSRVSVEGIQNTKKDGTKVAVWFNPSNLKITSLNLDDKERLNKKQEKVAETKTEIKQEKKNAPKKK